MDVTIRGLNRGTRTQVLIETSVFKEYGCKNELFPYNSIDSRILFLFFRNPGDWAIHFLYNDVSFVKKSLIIKYNRISHNFTSDKYTSNTSIVVCLS